MARPWMPLYIGDYLRDTAHLAPMEHGVYFLLMMHYWQHRCLKHCYEECLRIARAVTPAEEAATKKVLDQFFSVDGDVYRQKRLDIELERQDRLSAKCSARAEKAAAARWKDASSIPQSNASRMLRPQSQLQPKSKNKKTLKAYATSDEKTSSDIAPSDAAQGSKQSGARKSDAAKGGGKSERERVFEEEFWPLYPARDGKKLLKKDARQFFLTKIKDVEVSLVLQAAGNYAVSKAATDGFAKDAIRFLQKEFWRDWIEPECRQGSNGQLYPTDPEWQRRKAEIHERLYGKEAA